MWALLLPSGLVDRPRRPEPLEPEAVSPVRGSRAITLRLLGREINSQIPNGSSVQKAEWPQKDLIFNKQAWGNGCSVTSLSPLSLVEVEAGGLGVLGQPELPKTLSSKTKLELGRQLIE